MQGHHYMKRGLRDANQGFAKAIKAVRAGEAVVLTDRGRRPLKVKGKPLSDTIADDREDRV